MTIKTTWRHDSEETTIRFMIPPGSLVGPVQPAKKGRKPIPITVNGVLYSSVEIAAAELKISRDTLAAKAIKANSREITLEIKPRESIHRKDITIDGVKYNGYAAAVKATGFTERMIRNACTRVGSATLKSSDIPKGNLAVNVEGIIFESALEASRRTSIPYCRLLRMAKDQAAANRV